MKLLTRILNRIVFVRIEFVPEAQERVSVYLWQRGTLTETDWDAAKGALVALVVCGHGVVTKPDDSEIVARIKADSETFLWSSAAGRTSFVRRERMQEAETLPAAHSVIAVRTFCTDMALDLEVAAEEYVRQLYTSLKWKSLIRPTAESSAVTQTLLRRLALPVLGLFLTLLAANVLLSPKLNSRRQALQTELELRERTASGAASADARQHKLLAEFATAPAIPRAILCDRIAHTVPQRVTLISLEVEPLLKRFESGKPLQRSEGSVIVCGTAVSAADISDFIRQLSDAACCRDIRLTHVEKERDNELLSFRIETSL